MYCYPAPLSSFYSKAKTLVDIREDAFPWQWEIQATLATLDMVCLCDIMHVNYEQWLLLSNST